MPVVIPRTTLRLTRRLFGISGYILLALALAALIVWQRRWRGQCAWQPAVTRWWNQRCCRLLGVQITVTGTPAAAALLVANHISWLDIPVLATSAPVQFLSKAEIRRWPLIGWLATVAGTLFIERGAHQSGAVITALQRQLAAGHAVLIFPEGTTTDGRTVRPFYSRLFAAVQSDGDAPAVPIQPVALRYGSAADPDLIAPFINDDQFVSHFLRVLRQPRIDVAVHFLPPVATANQSRRTLAELTRQAIVHRLADPT